MISYELYNEPTQPPQLLKVVTVGDQRFTTILTYNNTEELDQVPVELISQHLTNTAAHAAGLGSGIEVLPDDEAEVSPYPFSNINELIEYIDIASRWWQYLYFRDEEHTHDV